VSALTQRLRAWLQGHITIRHVATLVTGAGISQILTLALSIPLARLYTPDQFGVYALYASVAGIITQIAALRYDVAQMLPATHAEARVLKKLATSCIVGMSCAACVVGWATASWFGSVFHVTSLSVWLAAVGLTIFLSAETTNLQYWLNRHSNYRAIAINRLTSAVGIAVGQLLCWLVWKSPSGLIAGSLLGLGVAYISAVWHTRDSLAREAPACMSMREAALRHKRMPLLNGPNVLVDTIRTNGMNFLVARTAVSQLGQFNRAWTITQAPLAVISAAVSQVMLQRLASAPRGDMVRLTKQTLRQLTLVGLPIMTVFAVLAPWLVPWLFGHAWLEAGHMCRALSPWLFMNVLTSALVPVFMVAGLQHRLLLFAIAFCAAPLGFLWVSPWTLLTTIWVLSILMAIMLAILIVMTIRAASLYDRGETPPSGPLDLGPDVSQVRDADGGTR